MIYRVKMVEQAENDIRNIYEYITYELQSPENAGGQLERIIVRSALRFSLLGNRFGVLFCCDISEIGGD